MTFFAFVSHRALCRSLALGLALICSAAAPAPSAAQGAGPPPEAVAHYNRAREHYQAGRYREAVAELEAALKLDPTSPNLVYNVARVYELLGEIARSIEFYKKYRDMLPRSEREERARVDSVLARLKGAKKRLVRPYDGPPKEALRVFAPGPPRRVRGLADATFWTVAGLGVATLAASAGTGWMALKREQQALDFRLGAEGDLAARDRTARQADRLALTTDVLLIAGGALSVTAILLYATRTRTVDQDGRRPQVSLEVGPRGGMLRLRGSL